jgi:RNA polymerase sigma factor (sigma-70 family)
LLARFVRSRDAAAFAGLVELHGRLVWNVCRRVLQHQQDAEDAFQATFVVLARRAGAIRRHESLTSWLYGVAYRVAVRARQRRRALREQGMISSSEPHEPPPGVWHELRPILDDEVSRLPRKYREPVVLCYFEGQTHAEAGRTLGWPTGTVAGRLARARDLLRRRLVRRGIAAPAAGLGFLLLEQAACAATPAHLLTATPPLAVAAAGGIVTGLTANVQALAQGVIKTMVLRNVLLASVLCLGTALFATGGSLGAYWALAPNDEAGAAAKPANQPAKQAGNPPAKAAEPVVRVVQLKHAKAEEVARIVSELYAREPVAVSFDSRSNALILRAVPEQIKTIVNEAVAQLDAKPDAKAEPSPAKPAAAPPAQVTEAQKERLAIAMKGVELLSEAQQAGRARPSELHPWAKRLMECEVELSKTREERLEAMRRYLAILIHNEARAKELYEAGRISHAELLEAKWARLSFQIELEKEQAK